MGVIPFHSNPRNPSRRLARRLGPVLLCGLLCTAPLNAQQEVPQDPLADLPESKHLAAALADKASRGDTLLTLAAVAQMLTYGSQADPARVGELEARFRDDRAWLDRLAGVACDAYRHGRARQHRHHTAVAA